MRPSGSANTCHPRAPSARDRGPERQVEGDGLIVFLGGRRRRTLGGIEKGRRAIAAVLDASIEGEVRDLSVVEPLELFAESLQFGIALPWPPVGGRLMGQKVELRAEHVGPGGVLCRGAQPGF